ncbi:AraC family transcriptional regulator [Rhodococcus qingshengii]|uniref:AraC family transcriptional regulator n=1 Tax=Rhodococcus qingshengii TaxID=334542 RepID=UPI001BEC98C2|nr:AraC family transcriptional regulator [Rhodococcus qingshengii]MBT2271789.1 AraC family transcriptional regulator [Rhodococcus qingshengii]
MSDTQTDSASDDVISALLAVHRLRAVMVGRIDLRSPWRLDVAPTQLMVIHVQLTGQCHIVLNSDTGAVLQAGDVAIYPHGATRAAYLHDGSDPLCANTTLLVPKELPAHTRAPLQLTDETDCSLVLGLIRIDSAPRSLMLSLLPPLIVVPAQADGKPSHQGAVVDMIALEASEPGNGSAHLLGRLAELVLLLATRQEVGRVLGGFRALTDASIAPALRAIHIDSDSDLSVATLASLCRMSRSSFASRFSAVTGKGPGAYVTEWRITVAADALATTDRTVDRVSRAAGYQSEAAFRRAFNAVMGCSPRDYRAQHQQSG